MKLIPLIISITSLAVDVNAQKFRQEQFPFPPQFQTPNAGIFSSDSSLYLPPESQTALPYFPMKNVNNHNLQFPYLPPTGTEAPSIYPSPFPFIMSTHLVPNFEEDDDEDHGRNPFSTPHPPSQQKPNQTVPNPPKDKKEMRAIPNTMFQQPIQNRNDVKFPFKPPPPAPTFSSPAPPSSTTPAARRMIVTSEIQRPEQSFQDQIRAASLQGPQFLPAGPGLYVSSTTEPAIPILRLSNEMDLDGSFSYEALGADQTHYVQHSRMENMGPDKQEQVVEGSYSYVGDNGQTYTVHYIADSNGFRASGDHLPVGPPVPEIIQRAVQYNLAEEAKKPPHLKSWQDDGRDNEINESEKSSQFFQPPATRNLFTGRTPEAFSYSYSQGSNTGNNLVAAASNSNPIKTVDYTTEQPKSKPNNGPISPQITFLASQGAHVPSMDTVQNTISRMFTTEKPTLPQLVNYEAGVKEIDQDPNKGLWRWQYGMNANNLSQNPNKDTISRSSGEGDDVMINFSDMTPEQYTNMIRSQFEYHPETVAVNQYAQNLQGNENQNNYFSNYYQNQQSNIANEYRSQNVNNAVPENKEDRQTQLSTNTLPPQPENRYQNKHNYNEDPQIHSTSKPIESRKLISNTPKILTQKDFMFPSPTITQSYNFEDTFHEPRKLKSLNTVTPKDAPTNANEISNIFDKSATTDQIWTKSGSEIKESTTAEPYISSVSNLKFTDFIVQESTSDFKPIITTTSTEAPRVETTTENIIEDILENNIFLKNLLNPEKNERHTHDKIIEEPKMVIHTKIEAEPKNDKIPKIIQYQPKSMSELKTFKKKPMDVAEIMNYVSMKNHFESSKVKSSQNQVKSNQKSKQVNNNHDQRAEVRFIPIQQEREENEMNIPDQKNTFRNWNQEELRGMIKNYKVLQRNNNHMKYDDSSLKRELSPPPLKSPGLPPLGRAGPSMKSYLPPIYV